MKQNQWKRLCSVKDLSCPITLFNGQCFHWRELQSKEYIGVVRKQVIGLKESKENVMFTCYATAKDLKGTESDTQKVLEDYFQLDIPLADLYEKWTEPKDRISQIIRTVPPLRLLRQQPLECLFSFICSSNNNISRITQMLASLRKNYGELLYTDKEGNEYFSFPDIDKLCTVKETHLRELGFGYRAKFICRTAEQLKKDGGEPFLQTLRENSSAEEVQQSLMRYTGVGRKVADCIALFSLDQAELVPVDTHVRQIAKRELRLKGGSIKDTKTISPAMYIQIGDAFRERFPEYCGWAHSVMFTADLSSFAYLKEEPKDSSVKSKKRAATSTDAPVDKKKTSRKRK